MLNVKLIRPVLGGLKSHLLGKYHLEESVGLNLFPRYCYSVWLRHLVLLHKAGFDANPKVVAELGPGDSLGTGLAALLTGAAEYHALDEVACAAAPDMALLDGIVALFRERADIPGHSEFPELLPTLDSYKFPSHILTTERLAQCLSPDRIERIRKAFLKVGTRQGDISISYFAPWSDPAIVQAGTTDLVFSQAVMEHVNNLDQAYAAMAAWIRPNGYISHQIDFRSHGLAEAWNGHWSYSDFTFWIVKGKKPYLLNREPLSSHLQAAKRHGFSIELCSKSQSENGIKRFQLAKRFSHLGDDDLSTQAAFIAGRRQ